MRRARLRSGFSPTEAECAVVTRWVREAGCGVNGDDMSRLVPRDATYQTTNAETDRTYCSGGLEPQRSSTLLFESNGQLPGTYSSSLSMRSMPNETSITTPFGSR